MDYEHQSNIDNIIGIFFPTLLPMSSKHFYKLRKKIGFVDLGDDFDYDELRLVCKDFVEEAIVAIGLGVSDFAPSTYNPERLQNAVKEINETLAKMGILEPVYD